MFGTHFALNISRMKIKEDIKMIKDSQKQNHNEEFTTLEPEQEKQYLGLCATCKNGPTCMFLNGLNRQILHCEEFEMPEGDTEKPSEENLEKSLPHKEKNLKEVKGLCATCDNLATCTYNKPESGVWHCEDYA